MKKQTLVGIAIAIIIFIGIFYFLLPVIRLHVWQASLKDVGLTELQDHSIIQALKGLPTSNMANANLSQPPYEVRVRSSGFHGFTPYVDADLYYLPQNGKEEEVLNEVYTLLYVDKMGNAYAGRDNNLYLIKDGKVQGILEYNPAFKVAEGNYFFTSDNHGTYIIPFTDTNKVFKLSI